MDLRYVAIFSIGLMLFLSSHAALADNNSGISWKIAFKKNGTSANSTIFWPPELQARQGDMITWMNNDTTAHTITSGVTEHLNYSGKVFDSGVLSPGQEYSFKIPSGVWSAYYYFCRIHPWMTGKIDVSDAYLGKSPISTISTDKNSYSSGDTMQISGIVNDTSQIMPLTIQIFDSQRNMVFSDRTNLLSDDSFMYKLKVTNTVFKTSGIYKIKGYYGFPATVTDVNFFFNGQNQNSTNTNSDSYKIPYWVKNTAKWWSQNQISDNDFIKGIQFLITTGDLKTNMPAHASMKTNIIPTWVKSTAGWWADGTISDADFISSIQYLIDHGIINV
ncbi:MAG: hypothetical protein KGI27_04405 [Thaumarchaeota archaeon]|nr:hypothetical protein [Nitrososphaerota archaeon]